jgi:hypothetical protein
MHIHDFFAFKRNLFITRKEGEKIDYTTIHIGKYVGLKIYIPIYFLRSENTFYSYMEFCLEIG